MTRWVEDTLFIFAGLGVVTWLQHYVSDWTIMAMAAIVWVACKAYAE